MPDFKSMCWMIPESINLDAILSKYPPDFPYKKDYFYHLIDLIVDASGLEDLDNDEGYVKLNATRLQQFNKNYKKYMDYLRSKGRPVDRSKYVVGKESFGYRILLKSDLRQLEPIPIQDFVIRKKVKRYHKEQQAAYKKATKNHAYLTKWFNHLLTIDEKGARKKVDELFPYTPVTGGIWGPVKGQPSNVAKRYKALSSIKKFASKDFYYSVDENIGRFHSNIANIKKELRAFIKYDGQKLVNIDIKNSQPLFSTLLLKKAFYQNHSKSINIQQFPTLIPLLHKPVDKILSSIIHYIMIVESSKTHDSKGFQRYNLLLNSGDFYNEIAAIISPHGALKKGDMKKMMFMVFFSSNKFIGQPTAHFKRLFRDTFPAVYEVFKMIKRNNHTTLSHLLQRIESNIIVEKAAKRIAMENPDLPIFTVHDSIATVVGNELYVSEVLREEIFNYTGLHVKLGIEFWG